MGEILGKATEWFRSFSDSHPLGAVYFLVFLIGVLLFVIGADGGMPYTSIVIPDVTGRYAFMASGGVLALLGLFLFFLQSELGGVIDANKYEFKIGQPSTGDAVEPRYTLRGTYKKKPPSSYTAYIVELDPSTNRYRPRKPVIIENGGKWKAVNVWSDEKSGRDLTAMVMLIGKNSQTLISYYDSIAAVRPAIKSLPADCVECDRVDLKSKGLSQQRTHSVAAARILASRKKKKL
jgi:hypothetical protein